MSKRLEGKVALITGAAMGMGESHARLFVQEGAKVIVSDIQDEAGQKLADELGENAIYVHLDVANEQDWKNAAKVALETFGPVTVVVNNAGITEMLTAEQLTEEKYMKITRINQLSIVFSYSTFMPMMRDNGQGGSFINISSIEGFQGSPTQIGYASTKFAVRGLTRSAAREFAPYNIRVNSVHPGAIETPILKPVREQAPGVIEQLVAQIPMQRIGDPLETSYPVLFLASDEASYMTGSEIVVDGGHLA